MKSEEKKPTPFLRWVGGKSHIINLLLEYLPTKKYKRYWEPFLGAGALFFIISPKRATISDINGDLINCYKQVSKNPKIIYKHLKGLERNNSKKNYYKVRALYNNSYTSIIKAARFIYLNKACFNGIFRVNKEGKFNVPYGYKKSLAIPSLKNLLLVSKVLKNVTIQKSSFEIILKSNDISKGDFIYLDPPYPPINSTSFFNHYTSARFSRNDQKEVSKLAKRLRKKGCFVMISNSDTQYIRNLYKGWHFSVLSVVRWVAANGSRYKIKELVITSYKPKKGKVE
jgi:DNA adenine methylase